MQKKHTNKKHKTNLKNEKQAITSTLRKNTGQEQDKEVIDPRGRSTVTAGSDHYFRT